MRSYVRAPLILLGLRKLLWPVGSIRIERPGVCVIDHSAHAFRLACFQALFMKYSWLLFSLAKTYPPDRVSFFFFIRGLPTADNQR